MAALLFVTGGARSGKSAFAERLATESGRPVVFIATLDPLDDEMRARVTRHRGRRPVGWTTVEAPLELVRAIENADTAALVLVDCVSIWLANRLLRLGDEPDAAAVATLERDVERDLDIVVSAARSREGDLVIVTNEVGGGVVPPYPLGRVYRDALGRANQHLARAAARAWLLVAGRPLELPPAP